MIHNTSKSPPVFCPFCEMSLDHREASSGHGFAFRDRYPVSPGHTLIVPHRHVSSWFELSQDERQDLIELMARCKESLDSEFSPHGYNIGINDGPAAGQTVMHVHLHLIPRYEGDVSDPRGGIRRVLHQHAAYWDRTEGAE